MDITQISPQQLAQFVADRPQQQNQISLEKIAEAAVHQVEARQAARRQHLQKMQKRSAAIRGFVRQSVTKISAYRTYASLQQLGYQLPPEIANQMPLLKKEAEAEMEELENRVEGGADAEEELTQQLLDAAESDPVAAAELISSETGMDVTPEDIEAATDDVSESLIKSELGDTSKESAAQRQAVHEWAQSLGPLSKQVILRRSVRKASSVLNYLAQQQR